MTGRAAWRADLDRLDRSQWPTFLDEHSGLPGPRANIELALAVADIADPAVTDDLTSSDDEYRLFCGAVALGASATAPGRLPQLRQLAADGRWRIREGVALGLQLLGDSDPAAVHSVVREWVHDPDPLVRRAAAAVICEPRLLRTPQDAALAIDICRQATSSIAALPPQSRRDARVRVLRQGLGYCWSVAIAADPEPGLAAFTALDPSDPDINWIITQNRRKKRLSRLLAESAE